MGTAIPIFDIDTHFNEPPDLWTARAPLKYKDQVLHLREDAQGHESWYVAGRQVASTGPAVVGKDMEKLFGAFSFPRFDQMARAGSYAPERLAYMDSAGVGTQIVYPNVIGFGGQALMTLTQDADLRLFHVQAYNDAILDLQNESGGRILPQAALPLWDMEATLDELERTRKLGLTGVAMSHSPGDFGQASLASTVWDRFFATCQGLEMPINFHVGSGNWAGDVARWWGDNDKLRLDDGRTNSALGCYTGAQLFLANSHDICNLICTGVLEKFPRLKFVSVESGCGWVPFVIKSLEYHWTELRMPQFAPRFKRSPTEMFLEQIYCSYWFEGKNTVDAYLNEFGADNLMFETDFPHPTSLYPNDAVPRKIEETLGHRDQATRERVLYRTAERVYGVKVHRPAEAELAL